MSTGHNTVSMFEGDPVGVPLYFLCFATHLLYLGGYVIFYVRKLQLTLTGFFANGIIWAVR